MSQIAERVRQDIITAIKTDQLVLPTLPEVALKVREVADDPNSDIDGVIRLTDSQVVQAEMAVDGQKYKVVVFNNNEKGGLKLSSGGFSKLTDSMYFWVGPEGTKGEDTLVKLNDYGLDGRCNDAFIPAKLSGVGKDIVYSNWSYSRRGLEHTGRVQALYDKTLDTLIKFYEKPK